MDADEGVREQQAAESREPDYRFVAATARWWRPRQTCRSPGDHLREAPHRGAVHRARGHLWRSQSVSCSGTRRGVARGRVVPALGGRGVRRQPDRWACRRWGRRRQLDQPTASSPWSPRVLCLVALRALGPRASRGRPGRLPPAVPATLLLVVGPGRDCRRPRPTAGDGVCTGFGPRRWARCRARATGRSAGGSAGGGVTRTYYIAADEVDWDYAPRRQERASPASRSTTTRTCSSKPGPAGSARRYVKCLYRGYTDAHVHAPASRGPPSEQPTSASSAR